MNTTKLKELIRFNGHWVPTLLGCSVLMLALALPQQAFLALNPDLAQTPENPLLPGSVLFKIGLALLGGYILTAGRSLQWRLPKISIQESLEVWRNHKALIVLLGIALALRLVRLGEGIWFDEILTHVKYGRLPYSQLLTTYDSENQHFLYSLFVRTSYSLFSEGVWSLRLPAVLFGVLSLLAVYLVGLQVTDKLEAFLATSLMGFSYHHLWFSQNARGYTGLLLWSLLSSWFLLRAMREGKGWLWVTYAMTAALGVFTHITMGFVIAGQGLLFLVHWVRSWHSRFETLKTGLIHGFGLTVLITFQLHALTLPQIVSAMDATESVVEAWKQPLWTLLEMVRGLQISLASTLLVLPAVAVFAVGLISYMRDRYELVLLFLLPAGIGGASVVLMGHHLWPRFFFFAFGFGALIAVRGVMKTGQWIGGYLGKRVWSDRLSVFMGLGMVLVSMTTMFYAYGPKQDFEGAIEYIEKHREPNEIVVTVGLAQYPYREYYEMDYLELDTVESLRSVLQEVRSAWLIYTLEPVLGSTNPELLQFLQEEGQYEAVFPGSLQNGEVYVLRLDAVEGRGGGEDEASG